MLYYSEKSEKEIKVTSIAMPCVCVFLAGLFIILFDFDFILIVFFVIAIISVSFVGRALWKSAQNTYLSIDEEKLEWKAVLTEYPENSIQIEDICDVELRSDLYGRDPDIPDIYLKLRSGKIYLVPVPDDKPHAVYAVLKGICVEASFRKTKGKLNSDLKYIWKSFFHS